jgi:hypothetical protein
MSKSNLVLCEALTDMLYSLSLWIDEVEKEDKLVCYTAELAAFRSFHSRILEKLMYETLYPTAAEFIRLQETGHFFPEYY